MPPKKKKNRIKTTVTKIPHDIDAQVEILSKAWDTSTQKEQLVNQTRNLLLSQKCISIDNALCLGLGSMEMAELETGRKRLTRGQQPAQENTAVNPTQSPNTNTIVEASTEGLKDWNVNLYQLLVFETVLACLRERFSIDEVRFQDPSFTDGDRAFLEKRGYTVLAWDGPPAHKPDGSRSELTYMDPQLAELISSSTMCYLPYLDFTVIAGVISAARPSLYLGADLVESTVSRILHNDENIKGVMEGFVYFVLSCDFLPVEAFGDKRFGFMWPADRQDEAAVERMAERQGEILNAHLERWEGIDEKLLKKKGGGIGNG